MCPFLLISLTNQPRPAVFTSHPCKPQKPGSQQGMIQPHRQGRPVGGRHTAVSSQIQTSNLTRSLHFVLFQHWPGEQKVVVQGAVPFSSV
ncbi:unnamed protein product [Gulo gulo]|uniref:Uncharacterized protein n=1 Tax=Gulo gulo TaxID=48420 RepID=A0A9X9LGP3_GULGU|nr:unnamed protein product [Gulo gulo]